MKCGCWSKDAHNCWARRYHGHTGVSELTVHNEGGPCECACHEIEEDEGCQRCGGTGWLDPIEGLDGSYITSRPCLQCDVVRLR